MKVSACALLAAASTATVAAVGEQPSFLFILGDDIGWSDFSYNNGTAATPRVKEWTTQPGTVVMQDFHTGGTVCSPTRATVLTGRNHFRDCVDYVYVSLFKSGSLVGMKDGFFFRGGVRCVVGDLTNDFFFCFRAR